MSALTQILNVLIPKKLNGKLSWWRLCTWLLSGTEALVDDDAIGNYRSDESGSVTERSPL